MPELSEGLDLLKSPLNFPLDLAVLGGTPDIYWSSRGSSNLNFP